MTDRPNIDDNTRIYIDVDDDCRSYIEIDDDSEIKEVSEFEFYRSKLLSKLRMSALTKYDSLIDESNSA